MDLKIAVPVMADRHFPTTAFNQAATAIRDSDCVDSVHIWDQMISWFPRSMWTPDRSPLARLMPDPDSFADAWAMAGYAAAAAPGVGLTLSSDALRRGPAEMMQTMLTLANLYEGKATFQIGGGEYKQCKPFGHKRIQGLRRLEDFFKVFDLLWSNDAPVSFEGNFTILDDASLGTAKPHRPKIWALGGGPQIEDLATTYADGFSTMAVEVWNTPEQAAEGISAFKAKLKDKGRDPEAFDFGIWAPIFPHEDQNVIDKALDNDLVRYLTAIAGRLNQSDWKRDGLQPPMPVDWHYALKLHPMKLSESEAMDMANSASREHAEKSYLCGTPKSIAEQLEPFVDAGVTAISLLDFLAFVLEPDDAFQAVGRGIEISRMLKNRGQPT